MTKRIELAIELDEHHAPKKLTWKGDGAKPADGQETKSIMISIWDAEKMNTVRFDLWTPEMMQHEMTVFVFQSLLLTAEAYTKATGNREAGNEIIKFAQAFATKTNIIQPKDDDGVKPFELKL